MSLGSRRVRLRAVWLLLLPFLALARPTSALLVAGGLLTAAGASLRAWSAGHIAKDRRLATSGPYAHTRNPLYLGSLLIGVGVTVAGGRWIFVALFLAFFLVVYLRTMGAEERILEREFGDAYRRYRERVPRLVPRLTPYGGPEEREGGASGSGDDDRSAPGFSLERYRRNREWEAALGIAAGFAFLVGKMLWAG